MKNPNTPVEKQYQPQEECLGLGYCPRCERACENDYRRQQQHGYRDAVDTYGEVDVERCEPGPAVDEEHRVFVAAGADFKILYQQYHRESQKGQRAGYSHGANLLDIAAEGKAAEHNQRNYHKVDQYIIEYHCTVFFAGLH